MCCFLFWICPFKEGNLTSSQGQFYQRKYFYWNEVWQNFCIPYSRSKGSVKNEKFLFTLLLLTGVIYSTVQCTMFTVHITCKAYRARLLPLTIYIHRRQYTWIIYSDLLPSETFAPISVSCATPLPANEYNFVC